MRSPTGPDAADAGSGVGSAVLTMQKLQSRYHIVQQSIFKCAGNVRVSGEQLAQRIPLSSGNRTLLWQL